MDSALPVIEVVTFRANQRCMEDLELFKEVRDIVAVSTRCVRTQLGQTDIAVTTRQRESYVLGP